MRAEFVDTVNNKQRLEGSKKLIQRREHQNTLRQINNILFSVDYTRHSRFMIQKSFSVYEWAFIHTLGKIKQWNAKGNQGDFAYLRQLVK